MSLRRFIYAGVIIAGLALSGSALAQDRVSIQIQGNVPLIDLGLDPCELTFQAQNYGSRTIERIKVGVSVQDRKGNTVKAQNINFRYIDPGKSSQPRMIKLGISCGGIGVVRMRGVEECVIAGKRQKTCSLTATSRTPSIRVEF